MALRSCALTHAELIECSLKLLTFYVFYVISISKTQLFTFCGLLDTFSRTLS